jgi:hypothetical protein
VRLEREVTGGRSKGHATMISDVVGTLKVMCDAPGIANAHVTYETTTKRKETHHRIIIIIESCSDVSFIVCLGYGASYRIIIQL